MNSAKRASLVRRAVLELRRPAVVAGIAAAVLYFLLPVVLGLDYRLLAQRGPYRLMWLNLLGAHYQLPVETPKPLHILLAGLLGSGPAFYALTCAMVGLCVAAAVRLGEAISGSIWPGVIAALTVFALRGGSISFVLGGGTEPFHAGLVLLALVGVAGGRLRLVSLAVFAACLCRPETWSLAPVPLLLAVATRRRFSALSLLPFAAPLVWVGFDRAMTGDWLYSLHVTTYYRAASPLSPSLAGSLGGDMLSELSSVAGIVPLVVGLAGLTIWSWKLARSRSTSAATGRERPTGSTRYLAAVVWLFLALPLIASWAASLSGQVLQMVRFHYPAVLLLTLFAAACPFLLFSSRAPRWLALAMSAVVAACAFSPKDAARSIQKARIDEMRATRYNPIAKVVKQLIENGSADVAIVSGRQTDYFARLLGPANSWKLISIRELMYGARAIPARARSAVLAYIEPDEITSPSADSVVSWVRRAWPSQSVLDTMALFGAGHGGVWLVRSAAPPRRY